MKKITIKTLALALTLLTTDCYAQKRYETIKKNTTEGTKEGVLDTKTSKEIIPAIYDKVGVEILTEGKFPVIKGQKIGFIDTTNKLVIPIIYSDVMGFKDNVAMIYNGNKWAMVNKAGTFLTQFVFDDVLGLQDKTATVVIAGKTGYVDNTGKYILRCKFSRGYDCWGDFILVYEKSFQSTGYEYVTTQNGNVVSRQDIGFGGEMPIIFNRQGKIVYKGQQYEKVQFFGMSKNVFVVKDGDGKVKMMDKMGRELIPPMSGEFAENEDWIKIDGRNSVGIMDFSGRILLKPNFRSITDYEFNGNTLAKAFFPDGQFFYINKQVKCVEYDGVKCPE